MVITSTKGTNLISGLLNSDGSLKTNSIILIVLVLALIIFASLYYYIYVYDSLSNYRITLLNKPKQLDSSNKQNDIIITPHSKGINPSEPEITYSMWMFLDDFGFRYGKKKHVFSHGYNPRFYQSWKNHRLMIKLGEINNSLEISITSHKEDRDFCENTPNNICMNINGKKHKLYGDSNTRQNFVLHNIPIKKWTHLTLAIVGDTASVYINGSLVKEIVMIGEILPLTRGYIFMGSNFDDSTESGFGGKLAKVEVFRKNLEANEVYSLYREGNIPRDYKKVRYIKPSKLACIKAEEMGCDSRFEFDTHRNGCCPNLRCVEGKCVN